MDNYHEEAKQERFDLLKSIAGALFFAVMCSSFIGVSIMRKDWFVLVLNVIAVIVNVGSIVRDLPMLWLVAYHYGRKTGMKDLHDAVLNDRKKERKKHEATIDI